MKLIKNRFVYVTTLIDKESTECACHFFDPYSVKSYSQEGEDMILQRIFSGQEHGFYVDVGAHHPRRFSNTYSFYCRGWRGINIEPNPEAISVFEEDREDDINLSLGIAEHAESLTYFFFDEPALNTFDSELVKQRLATTSYKLLKTTDIRVERLEHVLGRHLPFGMEIDFLSIDVEGLDFGVLKSNNWKLFRPKYVLAEALETSLEGAMQGDIFLFMKSQQYELFAKTYNTLFFRDSNKNY